MGSMKTNESTGRHLAERNKLWRYLPGFAALLIFDTMVQISLKLASQKAGPMALNWLELAPWLVRVFSGAWVYLAIVGYLGAFFCWMRLLKHAPVGPAFAASHLEVLGVLGLSSYLFREHLSGLQWLGAIAIVLGIFALALGERDAHL